MVTTTKKKIRKKTTKKKVEAVKTVKKVTKKKKSNDNPNLDHGHSKFDKKMIPVIKNLAYRGKTYSGISELLDISEKTFYNWINNCEELRNALEEAKADPLKRVEAALFERAMGYSAKETKTHMTKSGVIKTKEITKHYPPSETAAKYYLGNKDPDNWKEKREVDVSSGGEKINLSLAFNTEEEPDEVDARGGDEPVDDNE